jgi:hypothetical protein
LFNGHDDEICCRKSRHSDNLPKASLLPMQLGQGTEARDIGARIPAGLVGLQDFFGSVDVQPKKRSFHLV